MGDYHPLFEKPMYSKILTMWLSQCGLHIIILVGTVFHWLVLHYIGWSCKEYGISY